MNFDYSHYVPILKGKLGELRALQNVDKELVTKFTPLVEVPPIPPKYIDGQEDPVPGKSIDAHVEYTTEKLADTLLGLQQFFIDALYVENEDDLGNGESPGAAIFTELRNATMPFIPVIGLDRGEEYGDAVKFSIENDKRGCCVRVMEADLESLVELQPQVESLLAFLGIGPADVDLLIDFGPKVPAKSALPYQIDAFPLVNEWRTFTVASSAFPLNMSDIPTESIKELPRDEWTTWLFLRQIAKKIKRMPTFADYAINHPLISDVDPRIMNQSPNIRYTSTNTYVIVKGRGIVKKKKKEGELTEAEEALRKQLLPTEQYPKLSAKLKAHASWKTAEFSWGDRFIDACARKDCVGNSTDWRAVGTSHHIAQVVKQVASLPAPE